MRGGRNRWFYADNLVTNGLFRHTRNPMYVGKFFMIVGAGIASNRWPSLFAITAAYMFMYQAITLAEEAYLREKFGTAFDQYCRAVPRWWPRLRGVAETFAGTRFNWARVLAKEYSTPLGWTLPIVLIGLYNIHNSTGLAERPNAVATLRGLLGAVTVFWLFVGFLKKTLTGPEQRGLAPRVGRRRGRRWQPPKIYKMRASNFGRHSVKCVPMHEELSSARDAAWHGRCVPIRPNQE